MIEVEKITSRLLSEVERTIMKMRFQEEMTFKKISEIFIYKDGNKISEQQIRAIKNKACARLKVGTTFKNHKEEVLAALGKELLLSAREDIPLSQSEVAPSNDEIYKKLLDEASRYRSRYYASEYLLEGQT